MNISLLPKICNFEQMFSSVDKNKLYFCDKQMKKKSILLWDLENIPFSKLNQIKKISTCTPEKLYVVTKQQLGEKKKNLIESNYFKILDKHKTISDDKLIRVLKMHTLYDYLIIISSDSDFVNSVKKFLECGNSVQWIVEETKMKRILMKMDISNPKLKFSVIQRGKNENNYFDKW